MRVLTALLALAVWGTASPARANEHLSYPLDTQVNTGKIIAALERVSTWYGTARMIEIAAAVPDTPRARRTSGIGSLQWTPRPAVAANIADVIRCIRAHESGRYDEHSHPWSGSGADQWIPTSWAEWSVRAGYGTRDSRGRPLPTYRFAYLAPSSVQDAVTAYALTHGGAGNWSMNYGNDPCTSGMG